MYSRRRVFIGLLGFVILFLAVLVHRANGGDAEGGDVEPADQASVPVSIEQAQAWIASHENLEKIPKTTWKMLLNEKEFNVLWNKGTERAYSGELLNENRPGVFVTAGCRIPVFASDHKYKSGTGWPSFWEALDKDNIVLKEDRRWGMRRIEVLSRCGEHLGHVFEDGPEPTGLRYCINSAALDFVPTAKTEKASAALSSNAEQTTSSLVNPVLSDGATQELE